MKVIICLAALLVASFPSGESLKCYVCKNCTDITKLEDSMVQDCSSSSSPPSSSTTPSTVVTTPSTVVTNPSTVVITPKVGSTSAPVGRKRRDTKAGQQVCFKRVEDKIAERGCRDKTEKCEPKDGCYECETDKCNSSSNISIGTFTIFLSLIVAFGLSR